MSDHNEEIEENEPTRCRKCGRHYNLRVDEDPTPYCDWCAHKIVDELTAKLADAERERDEARKMWEHWQTDATVKGGELSRTSTAEQVWRNAFDEAIRQRDAAIARAEAAEAEARKARSVCEEIENYAMTANQSILDNEESIRHQIFDQIRDIARKGCTKCFSSGTYCELQEMKSANDELRREAEALKADKARLDWLEDQTKFVRIFQDGEVIGEKHYGPNASIREAIDAARA